MNTKSHHCLYLGCFNNRSNKNVTSFKFPVKDFQRTAEWQKNCGNSNVVLMDISELSNKLICEKHFIPTDININNKRKLLNKNAVPVKYVEPIISVQGTIKTYGRKRKTHVKENTENSSEEDEETLDILVHSSEAETSDGPGIGESSHKLSVCSIEFTGTITCFWSISVDTSTSKIAFVRHGRLARLALKRRKCLIKPTIPS
ncbi:hypothetical protein FQA39_LY13471 [Lamprigera yunnana]|nr:hypothetical protein FQA39_LY13471 [Lamprigera yunnana]